MIKLSEQSPVASIFFAEEQDCWLKIAEI